LIDCKEMNDEVRSKLCSHNFKFAIDSKPKEKNDHFIRFDLI